MRNLFIFVLSTCFIQASGQTKVNYFLPKKVIYVSVPFKITEKKLFKVDSKTGKPIDINNPVEWVTTIKVDGDIKVESKLLPNTPESLDLTSLGNGGKSFDFKVDFDDIGNGTISTINANQTPVTGEVIKGTVSIIGTVVKLFTGILGFDARNGEEQKTMEETIEQKIIEIRSIEIDSTQDSYKLSISPQVLAKNTVVNTPIVELSITKNTANDVIKKQVLDQQKHNGIKLIYRIPAEHTLQVKILNNELIKEQIVINERILIPQTGYLTALYIPILKRKKTFELGFNTSTGNLAKYGLKKESQLSENMSSVNSGIATLSTEITSLKNTINTNKEESEKKKKEEVDAARNSDLKNEIERLKLEKERLDLEKLKQDLIDELKAKKKSSTTDPG